MIKVKILTKEGSLGRYVSNLLHLAGLKVVDNPEVDLIILLEPSTLDQDLLLALKSHFDPHIPIMCIGTKRKATGISHFQKISYLKRPFTPQRFYEHLEKVLDIRLYLKEIERERPFLGEDQKIVALRKKISFLASLANPLLLEGEPGTGKELLARHLHGYWGGPFVKFAAQALPKEMHEALLFGFTAKAFPKIKKAKEGALHRARNGLLYIEGLEKLALIAQQKLLYFVETGSFFPAGSYKKFSPTLKLVVSLNSPPGNLLKRGDLLPSLYFRLSEFNLYLPPLRRRFIDLPILVEQFLENYSSLYWLPYKGPSPKLWEQFLRYSWPRNISEIERVIKDFLLFGEEKILEEITTRQEKRIKSLRQLEEELDRRFEEIVLKDRHQAKETVPTRKGQDDPRTGSR